jgi:hypothetical protein
MTRDPDFAERWMITSTTGRVYSRRDLLAYVRRSPAWRAVRSVAGVTFADVIAAVDDPVWMQRHAGSVPARVADAAADRALEAAIARRE